MIDQRNKEVSFFSAFADFFSGFVDFKGYTSIAGHWFPVPGPAATGSVPALPIAGCGYG